MTVLNSLSLPYPRKHASHITPPRRGHIEYFLDLSVDEVDLLSCIVFKVHLIVPATHTSYRVYNVGRC